MRTRYEPKARGRISTRELGRRLVQAGTLAYWLPCFAVDFYVLWRDGQQAERFGWVFQTLMREAVVYLALWLAIGASFALLFSRSRPEPKPRRRRAKDGGVVEVALSRQHRGL